MDAAFAIHRPPLVDLTKRFPLSGWCPRRRTIWKAASNSISAWLGAISTVRTARIQQRSGFSIARCKIRIFRSPPAKVSSASGTSHYAGLTFAFSAAMRRDLQVFGSYSITHASFINYVTGGVSYNGLPVSQTPTDTGNVGIVFEAPVSNNLVTARLWDQYVGSQPMWNNNLGMPDPTGLMIPSYNLVNGSLGYRFGTTAEPITLSLSATNLFNRQYNVFEYVTSGAYFAGGVGQGTNYGTGQLLADPGPPREVQLTISLGD